MKLLIDEDVERAITVGLLRRQPTADVVTVQQAGLSSLSDAQVLAWAAEQGRIVVSNDRATMGQEAYNRVVRGEPMPGLLLLRPHVPFSKIIEFLEAYILEATPEEMANAIVYIPQAK